MAGLFGGGKPKATKIEMPPPVAPVVTRQQVVQSRPAPDPSAEKAKAEEEAKRKSSDAQRKRRSALAPNIIFGTEDEADKKDTLG